MKPDVVVVGGGPAGSAAAITLCRLGRRVVVVDKATFPREKCCGDGLTAAALRRVEHLGLDPTTVASWQPVSETVVVVSNGHRVDLPLPGNGLFAASARRSDLDAALLDLARAAGAEVLEGRSVTEVKPSGIEAGTDVRAGAAGGSVVVVLEDGTRLTAPYVIAADGMWSPVRKSLGLSEAGYLGEWQAGRQYYENVGPDSRKLWVWFEPDMIPGYVWSFPLANGMANVGYGVLRSGLPAAGPPGPQQRQSDGAPAATDGAPGLRGQRIDFLSRPRIGEVLGPQARPVGPWRSWPIPARISSAVLSGAGGRVLFAGDAAGACDPMTGEGIAQALETGEMAARAVVRAGPGHPERASARYLRQIRFGLALDDRLARRLSQVLAHPTGSSRALSLVEINDWCRRNFARWMFEDYPRAVLATPHRWRRGMFTRPGASFPGLVEATNSAGRYGEEATSVGGNG